MTKSFYKEVDLDDRGAMVEFLRHHFRYHTMNSWNGLHSYANCIKVYQCQPKDIDTDIWYDMLSMDDWINEFCMMLDDWACDHPGYEVYTNGRSGGYLVLYRDNSNVGLDENADFCEWDDDELRSRVEFIQDFDRLCDVVVEEYIDMCRRHRIVEKQITVPKTIKVLEEV